MKNDKNKEKDGDREIGEDEIEEDKQITKNNFLIGFKYFNLLLK